MKFTLALTSLVSLLAIAPSTQATTYYANGPIQKIFSVDRPTLGANDSFLISGFTSAGSCPTNDGLIGLVLRDDEGGRRQMALLIAAKLAGIAINVRVDDAVKNSNGYCYIALVELD